MCKAYLNDSSSIYELIRKLPVGKPSKNNKFTYGFKNAIIRLGDVALPVDGIVFTYDTHESTEDITIYGEDSIMAIVKNITEGPETH